MPIAACQDANRTEVDAQHGAQDLGYRGTDVHAGAIAGGYVRLDGDDYYRIANSHHIPEFFMSLIGHSDHWMFVSSHGALTAGRRNADRALFPYATDDQLAAARASTGPVTLIRTHVDGEALVWEPFAPRLVDSDAIRRNLYKSPLGTRIIFEETHAALSLRFRYRWAFSERFGFVRSCHLENSSAESRTIEILDGVRNILSWGIDSDFQMRFSNLANAYKKGDLEVRSGLALYYLSSVPTDRAEPSEGLRATTVWSIGLRPDAVLLSAEQLASFYLGARVTTETDTRGKPGAFLLTRRLDLAPGQEVEWHIVADVGQDHCAIVDLDAWLRQKRAHVAEIAADVERSDRELLRILSSADAVQCTANRHRCGRHLSNVAFNVMRGGVPLDGDRVSVADFCRHIADGNRETFRRHRDFLLGLPEHLGIDDLLSRIAACGDPDLERLGREYLPLAFSRRHGDPTRPWNRFSIDLRTDDGDLNLHYEGNWRDIFQNWEALLVSFPRFAPAMIARFVNATTADGYNPYRLTRAGFEWEEPSAENPWANFGYWGDHQIIYLLKLLEWAQRFDPAELTSLLSRPIFAHAVVPYRIKGYEAIRANARETIEFDAECAAQLRVRAAENGAEGMLLHDAGGGIHRVTLVEKLLTLSLAKMANFVPDGGIWLNTQRPEWNDANNALVGNGLSMVTVCYLHRWFSFLEGWLSSAQETSFLVSQQVAGLFRAISRVLREHEALPGVSLTAREERVAALARAGAAFRDAFYAAGLGPEREPVSRQECIAFFTAARRHLAASIRSNRRPDGLYHAYNLLEWLPEGIGVERLDEMLEGQVAVLSAGLLPARECVELLDALRASALYRADQDSYLLQPDRALPRFLEKNCVDSAAVAANPLLVRLLDAHDATIVRRDARGTIHFNGDFRTAADLRTALAALGEPYTNDVRHHGDAVVVLFEETFSHRRFTGRSGTFFAYEGLGSIYWHMVSKLRLAVSENILAARQRGEADEIVSALASHYWAIVRGIGAEKSPERYGAFPSDPYSHTPENSGVKQPGMTGQVKEDILARFAELGVQVEAGCLVFQPSLFDRDEVLSQPAQMHYVDVRGVEQRITIPAGAYAFTLCQVPVVCHGSDEDRLDIAYLGGGSRQIAGHRLDAETSQALFARAGTIERIDHHRRDLRDSSRNLESPTSSHT